MIQPNSTNKMLRQAHSLIKNVLFLIKIVVSTSTKPTKLGIETPSLIKSPSNNGRTLSPNCHSPLPNAKNDLLVK